MARQLRDSLANNKSTISSRWYQGQCEADNGLITLVNFGLAVQEYQKKI